MVMLSEAERRQWMSHGWLLFSQRLEPQVAGAPIEVGAGRDSARRQARSSACSITNARRRASHCAGSSAFWTITSNFES